MLHRLCILLFSPSCSSPPTRAILPNSVYPVFLKAGCPGCHNPDGVASATRLHFPEPDAPPPPSKPSANRSHSLGDLLLNKPTRRVAHAGGLRIPPGTPEEAALKTWIAYLNTLPAPDAPRAAPREAAPIPHTSARCFASSPAPSTYNNTVRDLLGDDTRIADQFPPEDFVNGFKDQFQSQSISPLLAEAYSLAAEKLAASASSARETRTTSSPATPQARATPPAATNSSMISDAAPSAGRSRPRISALHSPFHLAEAASAAASFPAPRSSSKPCSNPRPSSPARKMAASPRGEASKPRQSPVLLPVEHHAGRGPPAGCRRRRPRHRPGVERAARRMLGDPRARSAVDEFISEWLRFDRVVGMVKDRRIFPTYTPELAIAMAEETRRLAADLVWNNSNFMKLFSADYTFVDSDLAALYNVPAPAAEWGRVALPESGGRAGILGQALFLASTSKPEETSPTARGLFVREQLLCQEVPPPPPGVNTNLPALGKDQPKTNRERLAIHQANDSCKSCHSLIDPVGFGFEKFDAIGQHRDKLTVTFFPGHGEKTEKPTTAELPLDSTGFVAGIPDSAFATPRELGRILEANPQCQACVVKQLFRYAAGRRESRSSAASDVLVLDRALADFKDSGFRFQDLMVSLVKYSMFPESAHERGN